MGWKFCIRVFCYLDELKLEILDYDYIRRKEKEYWVKMKFDYDYRYKVVEGKELLFGDCVWIFDLKVEGIIIK